jgi:hypothetical protein
MRVFRIGIFDHRQDRPELFLVDQPRAVGDVAHDGRADEETLLRARAAGHHRAVLPGVFDDFLDLVELHAVLQRPDLGALFQAVADHRGAGQRRQLVAHLVIDRLMHIEPLHGDADLAAVLEGAVENALGGGLRIDVVEHDAGVVAAQLQGDPLQGLRRPGHHLLAGGRRAGEGDLAHVGVRGHRRAQVVGVGDDVQDPGRQHVLDQFGQAKRGQRRGRGGLEHHGVAGQQRGGQLQADEDQREVPGHDGADDAERLAQGLDLAALAVLQHLAGQVHRGEVAAEGGQAVGLANGVLERLALFLGEQPAEFRGIGLDDVGDGVQRLLALRRRGAAPRGEGGFRGGHRLVQLGFRRPRTLGQHLFGRRIDHVHDGIAIDHLAVDQELVSGHVGVLSALRPAI